MSRARVCFGAGGLSLLLNGWALGLKMLAPFLFGVRGGDVKIKKRDKFVIGGIILVALSKIPALNQQTFDIAGLIGLIIAGAILGLIGYAIFGRDKKSDNKDASPKIKNE